MHPARQGWSVSLSSNGSILAVGGPVDGPSYTDRIGSTWLFRLNGSMYIPLGDKLVGTKYLSYSSQGTSVSLSSDGSSLAVGGFSDTYGFTPNADSETGYIVVLNGAGATWIFSWNGTAYNQVQSKIVGNGSVGNSSQQGYSVSVSGNGRVVAVGGPGDNNSIGAIWIFSTTAPPPPLPIPPPNCVKPCLTDYLGDRLVCQFNIGLVLLPKGICELEARINKRQCLRQALKPFRCYYKKSSTSKSSGRKPIYDGSCLKSFRQDIEKFRREKISKWIPTGSPTYKFVGRTSPTPRPTTSPSMRPTAPTTSPSMRPTRYPTSSPTVAPPPTNNDCASAIAIVDGLNGPFTNDGATTSSPPFNCTDGGLDVWFVYTATASVTLSIDTFTNTTFDTVLEVYSGTCGSLTMVGCNDDSCNTKSLVSVSSVTTGVSYYIRVGSFGSSSKDSFKLRVLI